MESGTGTFKRDWAELGERLRRFIGRRVNDPHVADDLAQDVLLKVQTQLDALPPGEKLAAWIFRIARNTVIDHYRARSVREPAGGFDPDAAPGASDPASDSPEGISDLLPCLERMVARLPAPSREAMRLADFQGMSSHELAARLGISVSGAKSRVRRARHQLRDMILDCCDVVRDGRGGVADVETTERSARYCGSDRPGGVECGR